MSLMNALMGNAGKADNIAVATEIAAVLIPGEHVEHAYKLVRDLIVFTNRRLLLIDKQGLTGKKVEFHSIPYDRITHFSVETAGSFDLDSEMNVAVSGGHVFQKTFGRGVDITEVQRVLATYVLKAV